MAAGLLRNLADASGVVVECLRCGQERVALRVASALLPAECTVCAYVGWTECEGTPGAEHLVALLRREAGVHASAPRTLAAHA